MIQIVSDSSTLYSVDQAKAVGLETCPLSVTVASKSYREFEDLSSSQLIDLISQGNIPTSSQPAIGEKIDLYNKYGKDGKVIDITMAAGLSGTYDSACMARESCDYSDNVYVFNSKTLCAPHRALVDTALDMVKENCSCDEIMTMLKKSSDTEISFLIPFDFGFLQRGGRVSKAAAGLGGLLKLIVLMSKSEDGRQLEKQSVDRTLKKTIAAISAGFDKKNIDDTYEISISHAFNEEVALKIKDALEKKYANTNIKLYPLSPAFITQGGPKCCAIQAIKIIR